MVHYTIPTFRPGQGVVVLVRYRAMIPFMYLLLLVLQLGSKALVLVNPIARSGAATVGAFSIGTAVQLCPLGDAANRLCPVATGQEPICQAEITRLRPWH
jgi:hypothetical protein